MEVRLDWRDKAICVTRDPEDFTYVESGNGGMGELKQNKDRLLEAADFCLDCPVMFECLDSATLNERFWTVRGGELPTIMNAGVRKRDYPNAEIREYLPDVCGRGHMNWYNNPLDPTKRYCITCANAQPKKREGGKLAA